MKPEVKFYPIVDLFGVERYLEDLYGENFELLSLMGDNYTNDSYQDYLVEPPEETFVPNEYESEKDWLMRNRFEKYLWENFSDYSYVILRICW